MILKPLLSGAALICFLVLGCGHSSAPLLGKVAGIVTMDGQPLSNATVMFQPASGRPSSGITDSSGHYTLEYTQGLEGATLGEHQVIIRTEIAGADGEPPKQKELLPPKYNNNSELTANVIRGQNTCNFTLMSK